MAPRDVRLAKYVRFRFVWQDLIVCIGPYRHTCIYIQSMCSSFRSSFSLNASIGEQPAVTLSAGIYTPVAVEKWSKLIWRPNAFHEFMSALISHLQRKIMVSLVHFFLLGTILFSLFLNIDCVSICIITSNEWFYSIF